MSTWTPSMKSGLNRRKGERALPDWGRGSSTLANMEVLYGLHPVEEALKAGRRRFDHVLVARERHDERLERLVAVCRQAGVRVRQEAREQLTILAQTPGHQGVVAMVRPRSEERRVGKE